MIGSESDTLSDTCSAALSLPSQKTCDLVMGDMVDIGEDVEKVNSGLGSEMDREMDLGTLLEVKKKQILGEIHVEEFGEGENLKGEMVGFMNGPAEGETLSVTHDGLKSCEEVNKLEMIDGDNVGNGVQEFYKLASVETVSDECGKEMGFFVSAEDSVRNGVRNTNQELDGKKSKRSRRKAKGANKVLQANEGQKNFTHITLAGRGSQKIGDGTKIVYSREEIEAMRFMKIVEQRKIWKDIYNGLGPAVAREYDDLGSSRRQKQFGLDFDPRKHLAKKEHASGIQGEMSKEKMDDELDVDKHNEKDYSNTSDPAYSESIGVEDSYTDLEEECIEDDDSEEDYASIQRPAFQVDGEPNFDSGPVEDGFEYLRRVRWEAAHIPKVKVAKVDRSKFNKEQTVYMPQIEDIAKCPEHLLPLKQWEEAFLADFSELRLALSRLQDSSDETFGSSHQPVEDIILESNEVFSTHQDSCPLSSVDQPPSTPEDNTTSAPPENLNSKNSDNLPKMSIILELDSVARVSMLRKHIKAVESTSALSRNDCLWLYALCASVDTPLDADTCAAFRSLLRKCASLRAGKCEHDDELIMLNILITVSGRYFGQLE